MPSLGTPAPTGTPKVDPLVARLAGPDASQTRKQLLQLANDLDATGKQGVALKVTKLVTQLAQGKMTPLEATKAASDLVDSGGDTMQVVMRKIGGREFVSVDAAQEALDVLREQRNLKPADWLQVSDLQGRLARGDIPSPADIAQVGWHQGATNWVGKRVVEGLPDSSLRTPQATAPEDDFTDNVRELYRVPQGGSSYDPGVGGSLEIELVRYSATPIDGGLTELARLRGWKTPEVGSEAEVQRRVDSGWTEIWRGVRPSYESTLPAVEGKQEEELPARNAEQLLDGLRNDPGYGYGAGIYGNGLYFSVDERAAKSYSGRRGSGAYLRAALKPDARVIEYDDLNRQLQAWRRAESAKPGASQALIYGFAGDPGRFAAMLGYDAIRVPAGLSDGAFNPDTGRELRAEQLVILNRGAMIVEEVNRKP